MFHNVLSDFLPGDSVGIGIGALGVFANTLLEKGYLLIGGELITLSGSLLWVLQVTPRRREKIQLQESTYKK